ncbi:thermonuclease family protein [Mycoplasma sp. 1781]
MKKIKLFLLAPIFTFPLLSVSCQNEKTKEYYDNLKLNATFLFEPSNYHSVGKTLDNVIETEIIDDVEKGTTKKIALSLWENFGAVEGQVTQVFDGDTIEVTIKKNLTSKTTFENGQKIKIRIPLIDTLEQNTKGTTERERKLSNLDSAYVENILQGKNVRLVSDNWSNNSYSRYVAYVFFGDSFEKNFSIEMLANGWTLPRIGALDFKTFVNDYEKTEKSAVLSYLLPYAARAFNDGYFNNKGFYAKEGVNISVGGQDLNLKFKLPVDLSKEYQAHGSDLINDAYQFMYPFNIEKKNKQKFVNPQNNIFEFLGTKQSKKEVK